MDKNKNNNSRTDLLAAGRKKLQQYRQKKDNKPKSKDAKNTSGNAIADDPNINILSESSQLPAFHLQPPSTHSVHPPPLDADAVNQIHTIASLLEASLTSPHQDTSLQLKDDPDQVGPMQEADSSGPKHFDRSVELELGRDDETSPGTSAISEKLMTSNPEVTLGVSAEKDTSDVEIYRNSDETSLVDSNENQTLCPGVQGDSLDLVQLAELLKGLPENDFRYLIKSREMASYDNLDVPVCGMVACPEIFQEHLYLANISSDFFRLQLLEQHEQQQDDLSLSVVLAQCRSELEVAIGDKLNFQSMYTAAKDESVEFSAKIDELNIKLDESVMRISSLSEDLANCKALLEASQVENGQLLNNLASVSEQRNNAQLASLELEVTNLKITIASMTDERKMLEEENVSIKHEREMLSGDLEDCRRVIDALQKENSSLTEESTKLKNHEDFLALEFEKLSTELVVYQDKVSMQQQAYMVLESKLKESTSHLEQMAEENIFLHSSLEVYKARIADIDSRKIQLSSLEIGSRIHTRAADTGSSVENSTDGTTLTVLPGFSECGSVLKGYLEEADKIMQKLEKAVDDMHTHTIALSRSSGKNAAPGVSKLIQAFESKASVDDQGTVDSPLTGSVGLHDPYLSSKEEMSCLVNILQALAHNVEHVDSLMTEENNRRKAAVVACGELEVEVEDLKVITDNLEERNIELEVICEAMNQHAHDTEAKKTQLEDLCEGLKRQYAALQLHYIELIKKWTKSHSKIGELQIQLKDIRKSSLEVASTIVNEVEVVQYKMKEDILSVERKLNSVFSDFDLMVQKLDSVVSSALAYPLSYEGQDSDAFGHFVFSVGAACEVIENLKAKLEAQEELLSSYREVEEKLHGVDEERNLAIVLLQKFSANLVNLLNTNVEFFDGSTIDLNENDQHDLLDAGYYEALVAKLGNFISDLMQLKEANSKLSSDLLNKANEFEELNKRCLDTDVLLKLVSDANEVLQTHGNVVDLDKTSVLHLESSVSLLIRKYKELEEQASLSYKECYSRGREFDELHDKVESLNSLIVEQQNDILILRESLAQAKDNFDLVQIELLEKVKELEQSEQRLASVREKLSIAVAKGKGLVVQRDGLKQSLSEMSSELEKCSHELQLKDSRILEVEEKLKNYSEAGERMEALESELTYIRNSATALRESFLMKDSTLQKIEEILEDLELPDHIHSKDIIEKVDWLSKTVLGTSSAPADWDQRSSVGGGSYSDAGFVVTDVGKDDVQLISNTDDDLRRKYEELQTKFYELAEQNDMLEQSLMERNILVQRWEEILDRINTPTQIRSMEPEERIHWLGTAVSEADQHMRSLQQKIENLENYCESLSNDLEESQSKIYELESSLEATLSEKESALSKADNNMKSLQQKIDSFESYCGSVSIDLENSQRRISELESSLQENIQNKEILSSRLVTVTSDREIALQTVAQYELELDRLQKDVDVLQGNLTKKVEDEQRRISELESFLQENIRNKEILSSSLVIVTSDHAIALQTIAQYELELDILKKEVDVLQGNLIKKLRDEEHINQIEIDLKRLQSLVLDALQDSSIQDEPSDVSNIQVLEKLISKLVNHTGGFDVEGHHPEAALQREGSGNPVKELLVTEEENEHVCSESVMDMADFKSRDIVDEGENIEDLKRELSEALDASVSLREERDIYWQKNQSMVGELEELDKRKKELQELLIQEEQKSASLREKLNLAVRKGKSLVQQRDGLKQSIEEMTAEIDQLKSTISSHEGLLRESSQKISDLSLQVETYRAFESENLFLKNRLIETEQHIQNNSHTLNLLLSKLGEISVGEEIISHDPMQKLEGIVKLCSDQQQSIIILDQEAKKSKKSAELLLAELNEVQERNDGLQEELERAYDEISSISKEKDIANSAKTEALSQLRKLSEEKENQFSELERLKSIVFGVKSIFDISTLSAEMFAKDLEDLHNVRALLESRLELDIDPVHAKVQSGLDSVNSRFKNFLSRTSPWGNKIPDPLEESAGLDIYKVIEQHLHLLTETVNDLKDRIHSHSTSLRTEAEWLSANVGTLVREVASQRSSLESVKGDNIRLQSIEKAKDMEAMVMRRSISLLYEACTSSIVEIENRKALLDGEAFDAEDLRISLPALPTADGKIFSGVALSSSEDTVKVLADKLLVAVKDFLDTGTKGVEGSIKEMKITMLDLQKELQEKDIQRERICMELVGQIKEAEASAADCSRDLQSMKNYALDLESELEVLKKDRSLLEQRLADLQKEYLSSTELGERVKSLTEVLTAKEQEIEALMQALEEEENQMETLRSKIEDLEKVVQKKSTDLEHAETSRAKALKKLSVTVNKFDELHHMSEGLLSEIENLHTQLQDRDAEISFLRQEVTRCTNDVLEVTKMAKERNSGELYDLLAWLDTMLSGALKREVLGGDANVSHHHEYKEHLQRDLTSLISELEDLRIASQSKDTLLQAEHSKIEELLHRKGELEASLHEKELHLNSLQGVGVSGLGTSEIVEVEPVLNKWTSPVPSSQVRSLRKVNNDQVSIAIDADPVSSGRIEDEEDDKVHGFKSLTTSRFVPKFTRPVSDMIDGLWVSCDRALMRQPALRLGIMIYWALLHAFLATFIV